MKQYGRVSLNSYTVLILLSRIQGLMTVYNAPLIQFSSWMGGKGPIEKIWYTPNLKKQIGMVAGGSGITPMLQESYLQYIPARVQLYTWEGYVSGLVVELEFGLGLVVVHSKVFDVQMWDKE